MTKTLSKHWREGTLERGYYYYKTKSGAKVIGYQCFGFKFPYDHYHNTIDSVKEVLAPVPNYDELQSYEKCVDMFFNVNKKWERTIKERKRLEKKLEIATKALKEYVKVETDDWIDSKEVARKALKEMKGVK